MSQEETNISYLRDPSLMSIERIVTALNKEQDIIVSGIPVARTMKLVFVGASVPRSEPEMLRIKTNLDVNSPVRGPIVGVVASTLSINQEFAFVVLPKTEISTSDLVTMADEQMRKMQHVGMSRIQSGDGNINIRLSGAQWAANDFE